MQPKLTGYGVDPGVRKQAVKQAFRLDALRRVGLFDGLSTRALIKIDQMADVKLVSAGDVVVAQGDRGADMMIVLDGTASVTRGDRKLSELTPGDVFGEMALLDDQPRSATVTAIEPMRLLVIHGPTFRKMLTKVPRLTDTLLASLSTRLREANAAADL